MNASENKKRRHTIGLLIDWLGGRYHSLVWPGVAETAEERDANLVIFSGGSLHSPHGYLDERNALYDLVSLDSVNGVVMASGSLANYISAAQFEEFYKQFSPLPLSSIALSLEGIPSVLVNNETGIKAMVAHLVEVHGYRRIAFVCGPAGHEEAEQRFKAYKAALTEHDLPFDPARVAPGDFIRASGVAAVKVFLDERKLDLDAIVAVDDDTAIGVIEALQARGYRIPGDIAVTGFDDIDEARVLSPALTTIRQPLYEQARKATELLLDQLDGKEVPLSVELPTELIVRQSCGCIAEAVQQAGELPASTSLDATEQLEAWRAQLTQVLADSPISHRPAQPWPVTAERLIQAFIADVTYTDSGQFLAEVETCLHASRASKHFGLWQNIISKLRQGVWQYRPDLAATAKAESLLGQARVLIADTLERIQAYAALQNSGRSSIIDEAGESLLTTLEKEPLMRVMAETLRSFGIRRCFIALYDEKIRGAARASLGLAYDESGQKPLGAATQHYPVRLLVPPALLPTEPRYAWNIEALYFQRDQFGFAIFELGPHAGTFYAEMRRQLSSALKGAFLLDERKQAEEALKNAYHELEAFSYSVSHDLRAPLRAIRGYSGMLQMELGNQLDPETKKLLDKVGEAVADMNAKIDGLLAFSRAARTAMNRTTLDLSALAETVISLLRAGSQGRAVNITITPALTAEADATLMRTVLENLLGNAWKYTSKTPDAHIEFGAQEQAGKTIYFVRDNGAGFNMKYADKLFSAFQRMHRADEFEGQGIGLATVKRIIQRHGGDIWAEAELGKGATFYFMLD